MCFLQDRGKVHWWIVNLKHDRISTPFNNSEVTVEKLNLYVTILHLSECDYNIKAIIKKYQSILTA